ncbi:uncharacterized protein FIBRA_02175 [Fibroporia radiculosa]|uniref:PITH domain-containing protein n=1 Tax=Fibroporia radiculosa TaxID=599839 RepID=J4G1E2_9APHY|nr:uncharacterized protein FIBRA_02175 [Fibroporia radiculosa]CCM00148.1 predicted protein [Fibroporia radiculosa]
MERTLPSPAGYGGPEGPGGFPPRGHPPPPNWQGQPGFAVHAPPPGPNQYASLYAAASDVLGMGPPPGAPASGGYPPSQYGHSPPPPPGQMPPQQYYANGGPGPSPVSSSQSVPFLGPGAYSSSGTPSIYAGSSQTSLPRSDAASIQSDDDIEFRNRPSLQRSGTVMSVSPRTQKTKAIDLSAPPYTKQYIDQYRMRIKDDPDPEAHFLYAKYLIEAAKRFGADSKDQRGVKKYRDALIAESLKVIRRLATQGQAYDEAQFFLANCHGTGMLGLQVDHERAYHLYLQAAKQNHAAACYRVAVCNELGAGTRKEPQRALAFYRKSASLGDTAAMYKLGVILLRGLLGEQPNARDAVGWLRRAAEQADVDNPHALHELGMIYENPKNGVVPYDPAYAKEMYTRAGHLGYTHSQYKLGQCYEYGSLTCPVDPRRSIAWYTKAAEKGHSEAELALSGWYLTGSEGVLKQSDSEAYLWARRAANKGVSKAEYAVGYYAEVGIGIKQDVEFAKRWYMRAAAQGNRRAMNRLTEMKRSGNKRANMARPTRQDAKDELIVDSLTAMEESEKSLLEHLDLSQLTCLNEEGDNSLKSILSSRSRNTGSSYLLSDVDEQLLLNITFNQTVRIRSIAIQTSNVAQAPRKIKLITNRHTLGFDDIEDGSIAQEFELSEDQVRDGKRIQLRYVRFQAVTSLHIFVESNQGNEDQTRVDAVDIYGFPVAGTRDLSGLKKVEDD